MDALSDAVEAVDGIAEVSLPSAGGSFVVGWTGVAGKLGDAEPGSGGGPTTVPA